MANKIKTLFDETAHTFSVTPERGIIALGTISPRNAEVLSIPKPHGTAHVIYVPELFTSDSDYLMGIIVTARKPDIATDDRIPKNFGVRAGDFRLSLDGNGQKYQLAFHYLEPFEKEYSYNIGPLESLNLNDPVCISPSIMHVFLQFMDKLR